MSKKLFRSIAAASAALVMATQAMAFSASAANDFFYYYNGIYYSDTYEAAEAAGNNHAAYTAVPAAQIPSSAKKKYHDPVTNLNYDTYEEAREHCTNPQVIYVGAYNINNNYYSYGKGYYCSLNGVYYPTYIEALSAAGNQAQYVKYVGDYAVSNRYYSSYTGLYYSSYEAALNASRGNSSYVTYMGGDYWYGYYGYGKYYSSYTGKYYNTYSDAVNASNGNSSYVRYVGDYYDYYNHSYAGYYYSSYTGKYYSTYSAAVNASNGNTSCVIPVGYLYNPSATISSGSIYKYYYNGVAYPTLDAAKKAGGTVGVDIYYSYYGNTERVGYYYYYNGTYYGTIEAAKRAGGTALGDDITYVPYGYYGDSNNGKYGYYYNGIYGYYDPYYAARNLFSQNKITSTKEAADGEPYIYGKKNRAGWDTVIKYIKNVAKGTEIKVDMNGSYVIPKNVLEALDGKNITITCVLDNGVKWSINGKDVDTAQDITIYTEYNISYIPNTLVSKAANNAVAKAQIGVSNNFDGFGSESSISVKFSGKRAGCIASVYRYDPDSNSLRGVDKAKVQSDGSCTFTAVAGGPYLIVLK